MAHRLDQQVAIITGASRGIGRAIAEAYAAEGASLCLVATDKVRLNEVKDALGLPDERIMTVGLNVTDRDACFAAPLADRFYVMEHGRIIEGFAASELQAKMPMLHEYLGV